MLSDVVKKEQQHLAYSFIRASLGWLVLGVMSGLLLIIVTTEYNSLQSFLL